MSLFPTSVTLAGSGSGSSCLLSVDELTQILLIAGGLNWGSIALTGCNPSGTLGSCSADSGDLVSQLSQAIASALNQGKDVGCTIDRVLKGLVGVSALYQLLNILYAYKLVATAPPNNCLIVQQ